NRLTNSIRWFFDTAQHSLWMRHHCSPARIAPGRSARLYSCREGRGGAVWDAPGVARVTVRAGATARRDWSRGGGPVHLLRRQGMCSIAPPTSMRLTRRRVLHATLGGLAGVAAWQGWPRLPVAMAQKSTPTGQMTWALHFTMTPQWFDPAETGGLITLTMGLYALHDALVKPMPDGQLSPCLATAWHESEDGLTYDFTLREGVSVQNGDPFTAEDVQFSFERYKGASAAELKRQVKALEIVDPHHVRFVLHEPWPDFLTFYATTATTAGWIVPKRYTEKIGTDAFKQ